MRALPPQELCVLANNLITDLKITQEALRLFRNANAFMRGIDRQYDDQFAQTGAKIGATLRIRLPVDYTVRTGPTAVPQDTVETNTTLTVATQKGVDMSFSSVDRAMSMDDFSRRYIAPAVNVIAGGVAMDLISLAEQVPNYVANTSGGAVITPTAATWLAAGAALDFNNAPRRNRKIIMDALTQSRTVSTLMGLFNPTGKIADQYRSGMIATDTLGFDWMMDQTTLVHKTAAYGTPPTVNGANQTGTSLTVSALTAPLKAGDIITIAGVNQVNRVTKASTGQLRQFAVMANLSAGATIIPIYPAITPAVGGVSVPYQTVDVSPANNAAISVTTLPSESYRKNIAFAPEAFTFVTADLDLPQGVVDAARENYDGISMRTVTAYNVISDQWVTRLDILYGFGVIRPEWAVIVADAI